MTLLLGTRKRNSSC